MADLIKTIGTASRDYSTIASWEADLDDGTNAANDATAYQSGDVAIGELYDDSDFTETLFINGGATIGLSARYLRPATGEEHDGTANTGVRILATSAAIHIIAISQTYLHKLEIDKAGYGEQAINFQTFSTTSLPSFGADRCLVHGINTASSQNCIGINAGSSQGGGRITNNIVYDLLADTVTNRDAFGINWPTSRPHYVANNTVANIRATTAGSPGNDARGIGTGDDPLASVVNNLITGVSSTHGTATCLLVGASTTNTNNATTDTTGQVTSIVEADQFVSTTPGSEDYKLKAGADAIDAGADLGSLYPVDIIGRDRDAEGDTWDIGAHEYVAAGGADVTVNAAVLAASFSLPTPAVDGNMVVADSYPEDNYSLQMLAMANAGGLSTAVGQSFTAIAGTLDRAVFYMRKSGSPTGNAVAKIYAHSGTYGTSSLPTGSALASSDNFDVSTLATSHALITFTFSGASRIALTNATQYVVAIEYSGGDSSNYLQVGFDGASPTHGGNLYYTEVPGSPAAASTSDLLFYVYVNTDSGSDATVNAAVQAVSFNIPSPTITAIRNVSVAAAVMAAAFILPTPTITAADNETVAADTFQASFSLPAATATAVRNVTASADEQTVGFSLPTPTATGIRNVSFSADTFQASFSLPAPTVVLQEPPAAAGFGAYFGGFHLGAVHLGGYIQSTLTVSTEVEANVLTAAFSIPAPTVAGIRSPLIQPAVLSANLSLPAPSIQTGVNVAIDVLVAQFSLPAPSVSAETTVSADLMTAAFSLPLPTVTTVRSPVVAADVLVGSFSLPEPTVSGAGDAAHMAEVVLAQFSLPAPTVTAVRNASVSADVLATAFSLPAPAVQTGVTVSPAAVAAVFSLPAPTASVEVSVTVTASVLEAACAVPASTVTTVRNPTISPTALVLAFSLPSPTVTAFGYSDKYSTRGSSSDDKYSQRGTTANDKYSQRTSVWANRYS